MTNLKQSDRRHKAAATGHGAGIAGWIPRVTVTKRLKTRLPTRALVLAAGFGTRMRPLSERVPKPLMPLWGKPILEHLLERLRDWGVREAVVNAHHGAGQVGAWVKSQPVEGLRLHVSLEKEILGTGGAVVHAKERLGKRPFWIANADVAMDLDPAAILERFGRGDALAALWTRAGDGPRTVTLRDGLVENFRGPHGSGVTFCGLHLVSPRILDFLPPSGFADIIRAYEAAMRAGEVVAGVEMADSFWADLGTPEQYLEAHRKTAPGRTPQKDGYASVASNVVVTKGARVTDSVIWSGARLGPRARVHDAIVAQGVNVNGAAAGIVMRAGDLLTGAEAAAATALGWEVAATCAMPADARGSQRRFIRLQAGRRRLMLVRYSTQRRENKLYAGHARLLAEAGLPVPAVLHDDPARHFTFIEDLGDRHLLDAVRHAGPKQRRAYYEAVLDAVAAWHRRATRAVRRKGVVLMPPFGPRLYRWEHDLFRRFCLRRYLAPQSAEYRAICRELRSVPVRLRAAPPVLVHRDLQSSNILLTRRGPHFIDFQGMRRGPAAYDLAALLCDPYVDLAAGEQQALLEYYLSGAGRGSRAVRRTFAVAAVQRLIQALGAYGRLAVEANSPRFLEHVPAALGQLHRAAESAGGLRVLSGWAARPFCEPKLSKNLPDARDAGIR